MGGGQSREHGLPTYDGIARLQLNSLEPSRHRSRHHESVADSRLAFLVEAALEGTALRRGDVTLDLFGSESDTEDPKHNEDRRQEPPVTEPSPHRRRLLPDFQNSHEVQTIEPSSDDEARNECSGNDGEK